jgi:predicted ribosomally synthesized peptide with SipW-like signal peptide
MKKKILALALVVAMLAVAIVSASLAYFTDEEYETNTFTLGEIDITLEETFGNEDKDGDGKDETKEFYPGVPVKKEVWVENTSETGNDAYVRVHVAFPVEFAPRRWVEAVGTVGQEGYVAAHYEYDITGEDGLAVVSANTTEWTWTNTVPYYAEIGEDADSQIPCVVFVATYNEALKAAVAGDESANPKIPATPKGVTEKAITAIELNEKADTDMIEVDGEDQLHLYMDIKEKNGKWDEGELRVNAQGVNPFTIEVEVAAEAVQVEGLGDVADTALDKAFGVPGNYPLSNGDGEYTILWNNQSTPAEGEDPDYPTYDHN